MQHVVFSRIGFFRGAYSRTEGFKGHPSKPYRLQMLKALLCLPHGVRWDALRCAEGDLAHFALPYGLSQLLACTVAKEWL